MINNVCKYRLEEKDLHLTGKDYRIISLKYIVNRYLKERNIDVIEEEFDFNISIKNVVAIVDKINTIVEKYEPKKVEIKDKKAVVSTLKYWLIDHYLDPKTIFKLHKNNQHNKIYSLLNKYLKESSSVDEIIDVIEMYRNIKKIIARRKYCWKSKIKASKMKNTKRLELESKS